MVHGKKPGLADFPESGWLDVKGRTCEGNWVAEEGVAVEKLLLALRHQHSLTPDDVFLISPFRDCAKQLNRIAKRLGFRMDRTGTVHKTQGKEAAVVILVLGGNIKSQGAKAWAAEKPNLGVFCEPIEFTHSERFTTAIQGICCTLSPATKVTFLSTRSGECHTVAFDFFLTSPPDVFITQNSEKTRAIMQAAWFGSARDCPPIVQLSDTLPTTCAGVINYQMNYARLGRMIADHIRQPTEQGECSTIIPNVGFPWCGQSSQSPESNATLNMLILPSPSTDALRKLLPHFYRTSGIKVNLAIYPYDEVFNLRQAEIIIGQGVTNVVNGVMAISEAVQYINERIIHETGS